MASIRVDDVGLGEAAAEVARGGGVGDASGAEGVEVDLVVAPQLEVLDAVVPPARMLKAMFRTWSDS